MMVVYTSALMAFLLDEPEVADCAAALSTESELAISRGTVAEALIFAARRVARAYGCWGKGIHRAALNFGDCFAYALAAERRCRLLYVGDDFSRTDIRGVL